MRDRPPDPKLPVGGRPAEADDAAAVERALADQREHWERGGRDPVEAFLERFPSLRQDAEAVLCLIFNEVVLREERGESPRAEEFQQRFPHLAAPVALQFGMDEALRPDPLGPATIEAGPGAVGTGDAAAGAPHRAPEVRQTILQSHPAPSPLPNALGRYRIIKILGQGGMGTVYHAHDEHLDRPAALKVMRSGAGDPAQVERFFREARIAASFTHPHLCPVYDFALADGVYYLTMPLIAGEPLSERLRRDGPMPEAEAARLTALVARAVHEAHRAGVIHRDLKPGNVMLNERREPVVMDFGLARRFGPLDPRMTRPGELLGTPAYMPPEQICGGSEAGGPTQDVYSLGVLLYEALTGRLPFESDGGDMLRRVLAGAPVPPSSRRPGIDGRLERICLKAMARDPAARFPTMAAFAEALEAYGTGRGSAAPPTAPEPAQKATSRPRPSRRLLWLAGVLLGAVVVAAIAAVGFALSRQGPAARSGQVSAADQPPVVPTAPHDGGTPGGGADGFSAGGMWVGTFERPGDNYAYRAAVQIERHEGEEFEGTYIAGDRDCVWKIKGTVRGDKVWWEFTEAVHEKGDAPTVVGTTTVEGKLLNGDQFEGRWENPAERAKVVLTRKK